MALTGLHPATSISEGNKAVVLKSIELFNARDWEGYLALCTEDSHIVDMATGAEFRGHSGWMDFCENATSAFPDCTLEIYHILADDDGHVASQCIFQGTNTGDMAMGTAVMPATGKHLYTKAAGFFDIRDGKIATYTRFADSYTVVSQLGLAG